jgi:antitoxin component of RelBE/YafQ-DinJ toxin-antitoxin module
MPNVTLSVDEKLLNEIKQIAARRGTTVNAMVRAHFEQLAKNHNRAKQAMKELREMSDRSSAELGKITWTRDDLYER